jgi:NifU-like protein involved in Fe-S cluster formation
MADLSDIYSDRILTLAAGISRAARLSAPTATASAHSKMCGSTITVDVTVADGRIVDFGQIIKACLLGQAAAAVMAEQIIGTTPDEIRRVGETMRAMLKRNGPPPAGRWADLSALEPVREAKGRHASTLLVFDAVERALAEFGAEHDVKAPAG